jgi:acetyl esterase/lipase
MANPTLGCLLVWTLVLTGCDDVTETSDVVYDPRFPDSAVLDIYAPPRAATPRPAVLVIHGGGWRRASIATA